MSEVPQLPANGDPEFLEQCRRLGLGPLEIPDIFAPFMPAVVQGEIDPCRAQPPEPDSARAKRPAE